MLQPHPSTESSRPSAAQKWTKAVVVFFSPLAALAVAFAFFGVSDCMAALTASEGAMVGSGLFAICWVMFVPIYFCPGAFRRPDTPMREYFTEDLAAEYAPEDFSMATGAHNSQSFDVRLIDETAVAEARIDLVGFGLRVDVDDHSYRVNYERQVEKVPGSLATRDTRILTVYNQETDSSDDQNLLVQLLGPHLIREPYLIRLEGVGDIVLQPNPPVAFPRHWDMVMDGEVIGKVIQPGKMLFRGIVMVTPAFPPKVRALLNALCYYLMK